MNSNYGFIVLLVVGVAGLFAILAITDSLPSGEGLSTIFSGSNLFGLAGTSALIDQVEETIAKAKEGPGPIDDLIAYTNTFRPGDSDVISLDGSSYQLSLQEITYEIQGRWLEARILINGESYTLRSSQGVHFDNVWYLQVERIEEHTMEFDIRHFQAASTCSGLTAQTAFTGQNSVCCEGELQELPNCLLDIVHEPLRCGEWIMYCEAGELKNRHESTPFIPPPPCPAIECQEGEFPITTGIDDDNCPIQECVPDFECTQEIICCDGTETGRVKETGCGCPIGMQETPELCGFNSGGWSTQ